MGRSDIEDRLLARLSGLGEVSSRPLHGGRGLYRDGTIFGILSRDRLYLRVGEANKGEYLARGMPPFRPNDRQTLKSYYQVPPEVLAEPEALISWVEGRSGWASRTLANPEKGNRRWPRREHHRRSQGKLRRRVECRPRRRAFP